MNRLTPTDEHLVVSRLPKDVRAIMRSDPRIMVGGGFIRATIAGEKPSDIDLFGPSKEVLKSAATAIALERKGRIHETDNAFTVLAPPRMPLQFISRWVYDDPERLIAEFDFTICQAVVVCTEAVRPALAIGEDPARVRMVFRSVCSEGFYSDLAARRLVYTFPQREEDAGGSLLRVRKYLARGYNIQVGSLGGVISRLMSGVRFDSDQVHTDERFRAKVITGLLREVDPMLVVDGVEIIDEHERVEGVEAEP